MSANAKPSDNGSSQVGPPVHGGGGSPSPVPPLPKGTAVVLLDASARVVGWSTSAPDMLALRPRVEGSDPIADEGRASWIELLGIGTDNLRHSRAEGFATMELPVSASQKGIPIHACLHSLAEDKPGFVLALTETPATTEETRRFNNLIALGIQLETCEDRHQAVALGLDAMRRSCSVPTAGFFPMGSVGEFFSAMKASGDNAAGKEAHIVDLALSSLMPRMHLDKWVAVEDVRVDPRTSQSAACLEEAGMRSFMCAPFRRGDVWSAIAWIGDVAPRRFDEATGAYVRAVAERIEATILRQDADGLQATINEEVAHRMKNLVQLSRSLARNTLAGSVPSDVVETLCKRLGALESAQRHLAARSSEAGSLNELIQTSILAQFGPERTHASGPPVTVGESEVTSLSLILHELTTNAAKYGALSTPSGMVEIEWKTPPGDKPVVELEWRERGGPPVAAPAGKSFGSRLISNLGARLGSAEVEYDPGGLQARFRFAAMRFPDPGNASST